MAIARRARTLLALAAACGGPPDAADPVEFHLAAVDTLITAESARLGRPSEVVVDTAGRLYVTDLGTATIVVLDSLGAPLATIGRRGAGPGEFTMPRAVTVEGDSVRVADPMNGRFQVLTTAGAYARSVPSPAAAASGAVAFRPDGSSLVALNGRDGALAIRVSPTGGQGARFGQPMVVEPEVWDFTALKSEIASGRVPAAFRNITHPVPAPDGGTWLILDAEALVRRYDDRDSLVWEVSVEEPELTAIREEFIARNRADSDPSRLFTLSYLVAGQAVGDDLWVLLRQPEGQPSLILVLARDGRLRARVRVPATGIRAFAVDPARRLLYLIAYQDAALLRVRLPTGLGPDAGL